MTKHFVILLLVGLFAGCERQLFLPQGDIVTRVGFLAVDVVQHPIVSDGPEERPKQFYFDLGDKPGSMNQIIVVYPAGVVIPNELDRKIELTGTSRSISVTGGKVGDGEYSNESLRLLKWRYLD